MESVAKQKGYETFVFRELEDPREIFDLDYNELKSSNVLIAEISEPSHGVGMEIGMSYCLGLTRVLLYEKGKELSKIIQGAPDTFLVEYENVSHLEKELGLALDEV